MGVLVPRLSTAHMVRLTFHLWSLYRAGTSLRRAFALLDDPAFARPLRSVGREVAARLQHGESLADALTHVEHRVPVVAVNLLIIGDRAGGLEPALAHLHRHYERRLAIQRRAVQIALYPALIVISAYVIRFIQGAILTDLDVDTYIIQQAQRFGWYVGTRIALIAMAARILDQWKVLTPMLDFIAAHAPFIRNVVVPLAFARFFRSLRLMFDSGCHTMTAVETAIRGTSNVALELRLRRALPHVQHGRPVLESLAAEGALPPLVREMLVTGEYAGRSEENLDAAAEYLEAEATTAPRLIGAGIAIVMVAGLLLSLIEGMAELLQVVHAKYLSGLLDAFTPIARF